MNDRKRTFVRDGRMGRKGGWKRGEPEENRMMKEQERKIYKRRKGSVS